MHVLWLIILSSNKVQNADILVPAHSVKWQLVKMSIVAVMPYVGKASADCGRGFNCRNAHHWLSTSEIVVSLFFLSM